MHKPGHKTGKQQYCKIAEEASNSNTISLCSSKQINWCFRRRDLKNGELNAVFVEAVDEGGLGERRSWSVHAATVKSHPITYIQDVTIIQTAYLGLVLNIYDSD